MDFFEGRYYWLNRKLLLLVGQWPYQKQTSRIQRHIIVLSISLSVIVVQMAKLATSKADLDLCCQIFAFQVLILMCVVKYFTYSINIDKVKGLLEVIKSDWESLIDGVENEIVKSTAEEGRLYNVFCTLYMYSAILLVVVGVISPSILDYIAPINGSHPRTQLIQAEYFVDEEKYFYPILMHITVIAIVMLTVLIAADTFYMTCVHHSCAMFNVVSHRLEHIFDKCNDGKELEQHKKSETCTRIAKAVECHKNATEYADEISSTFGISHLLTLLLALVNISVSMYWTIVSWEEGGDMLTALIMAVSHVAQLMIMYYPPQKLLDSSAQIGFKAYSGKWYMAPTRIQCMLVPIMVRSMKPSMIMAGSLVPLTFESSCTIIQTSVSYCMALLSLK